MLDRSNADLKAFQQSKDSYVEWFDADAIVGPVQIRARRDGDRFWPMGAVGEKKVGKFLTAAKIDPHTRPGVFVIADAEKILWLVPIRACEQVKVTNQTSRILQVIVK